MVSTPQGRLLHAGTLRHTQPVHWEKPRVFGSYAIVYLAGGRGTYSDARGVRRPVEAGDLLLVFPKLGHRYGPGAGDTWEEIFLVFDGPLFELMHRQGILNPKQPVLRLQPVESWFRRIEAVASAARQPPALRPIQIVARLHSLLCDIVAAQASVETPAWVQRTCAALADLDYVPDWHHLARDAHLSYDAFRKNFARWAGQPPARYRTARLLERATALLHDTELPQREIARQLGFADEFHFSKAFKRHMGFSPSALRPFGPSTRT